MLGKSKKVCRFQYVIVLNENKCICHHNLAVLSGPAIRKLISDSDFDNYLTELELLAWNCLKAVIENCMGVHRVENWQMLINEMLRAFDYINVQVSLKVHFMICHLDWFERLIPTEADEDGERFHEVAAPLDNWYSAKKLDSLLADLCWDLFNED